MNEPDKEADGALRGDLPFAYRLYAGRPGIETFILLHGSGVDEETLVPLARQVSAEARLIAVRGRVLQDDSRRWFTRITPTIFDQKSIRAEAAAFATFVREIAKRWDLEPQKAVFLGYSNGANLVSSIMLLHPGLVRRAVLLRSMPVLDDIPTARLDGSRVLVASGANDVTYGPFGPHLADLLSRHGADVDFESVSSGHEFGTTDAELIRRWLALPRARHEI